MRATLPLSAVAAAAPLVVAVIGAPSVPAVPAGADTASIPAQASAPAVPRAKKALVVKGTLTGAGSSVVVLLVGSDGTSVSTRPTAKGAFTLRVTNPAILRHLVPGKKKGTGPALHLVRSGDYGGPFVLRSKKSTGYGRLAPTVTGTVDLGKLRYRSPGYVTAVKAVAGKRVDTRHVMTLKKGVPLGAGTFGATGRLAPTAFRARAAVPAEVMPTDAAGLGSDADDDGVPNVADVDMNGDQVLDAAQAESPLQKSGGGTLSGDEVLSGRPRAAISFAKILNADSRGSVNSNVTPGATWEQLGAYLQDNLMIETIVAQGDIHDLLCPGTSIETPCALAETLASITMDCRTLVYCQDGTPAIIRAEPSTGLDGKPLSVLFDDEGLIQLPQDTHYKGPGTAPWQTGFQLNFLPRGTGSALQFIGDSFEYVFYDANGAELARQVKVLTSSVITAPEFTAVAGTPSSAYDDRNPLPITADQARALTVEFVRPQRLDTESADAPQPTFIDRGGLEYDVYVMSSTQGGPSPFYWCRSSQVTSASPDLTKVTKPQEQAGRNEPLFDTAMNPANGGRLAFTLDLAACVTDPANTGSTPPSPGTTLAIEMESSDSDGNSTRTRAYVKVG